MTLLVAPFPVQVPNQPLMNASKELPTTLHTGEPDQGEPTASVLPADVFEAQELESLRPSLPVHFPPLGGKTAKEQQPSFLLGQFKVKSGEAWSAFQN